MSPLPKKKKATLMTRRSREDTTIPPITGSFEDAVKALLQTPPPPKNLGRPKAAKTKTTKKR